MDCSKVGALICSLRREKGLTQRQVAAALGVTDKTISKWERGRGCPDVTLLADLSAVLGVQIEPILQGALEPNEQDGGNMKRIKFYVCPTCGNVVTGTGEADISCCGRRLSPLTVQPADEAHLPTVEEVETEYYLTFPHEMTKAHFLRFVAVVDYDRMLLVRLYPEQTPALRVPQTGRGTLYFCCSEHGLMRAPLRRP